MSDYMPDEVLMKILAYLPPKSLVRFTSVCKSWQSLITSSDFITTHLNRTRLSANNDYKPLLLLRYYPGEPEKEQYSLHVDNKKFDKYQTIDFPFESELYFRVLGSCNGLICLSDDYCGKINSYILWNPSVRKSLNLPLPKFTFDSYGPYDDVIGFGFDSRNNDYKVVRVVFLDSERDDKSPRVEVFKLSTGRWETIAANIKPSSYGVHYNHSGQAFFNGAVHWCFYERGHQNVIMAFDVSDEAFRVLKLPPSDGESSFRSEMPLAVCGDCLSFFHYHTESCSIWVMKEYNVLESWSKLYTVDLSRGLSKLLSFRINGDIIIAKENTKIVSYDPHTTKSKYLGVHDSKKESRKYDLNRFSFYVGTYEESLVLLDFRPAEPLPLMPEKRKRKNKRRKKNRDVEL